MKTSSLRFAGVFASAALALAPVAGQARAKIVIHNVNAPGDGFNDPTPVTPVGGNPGTTLGEQRLVAFQFAASLWGATIDSDQTITIDAQFSKLDCSADGAVLGAAGPTSQYSDDTFPNPGVWYPAALANAFGHKDYVPGEAEIDANFNEIYGTANCFPQAGWYLGLDGQAPDGMSDLATVLLHEFSHGLGFLTYTSQAGAEAQGIPDVFETFAYDHLLDKYWSDMTDAERAESTLNDAQVVWTGSNVVTQAPGVLQVEMGLQITPSGGTATDDTFVGAEFGPPADQGSFAGEVALAQDANGGSLNDGCKAVTGVSGKIALVDRLPKSGSYSPCTFKQKVLHAQQAGAVGVIVADYAGSDGLGGMADDPDTTATITIPSVFIGNAEGVDLKSAISAGATQAAIVPMPGRSGTDASDQPYLFTPAKYQPGSSVSHWGLGPRPSLLMEPYIHADIPLGLDLTPAFMHDIGWTIGSDVTLAVAKAGSDDAWPGGTAQYIVTVLNHGNTDAQNVNITADTPNGLTLKSVTGAGCSALPCNVGTVAADSRKTVVITFSIPVGYTTPDPVVENVSFTSSLASTSDNAVAFSSKVVQAADVIANPNVPGDVSADGKAPIPITITNNGPSVAEGLVVTTDSATNVEFAGFSGDCSGDTCQIASLNPGESKTVNVLVNASSDKEASFLVHVTTTTQDPYESNNTAKVAFTATGGGCTAPGSTSFLSLLGLAGVLFLRRRRAQA